MNRPEQVASYLAANPGPVRRSVLMSKLGIPRHGSAHVFNEAVRSGYVQRIGIGWYQGTGVTIHRSK